MSINLAIMLVSTKRYTTFLMQPNNQSIWDSWHNNKASGIRASFFGPRLTPLLGPVSPKDLAFGTVYLPSNKVY